MEARIDAQKVRKGQLTPQDFKRIIDAAGRMHNAEIFIDDTPALSIGELRSKCRRLKQESNIGMAVVDYLQLMTAKGLDTGSREQEIAAISRGLKSIAMELKIPVIALSHLSRAVEQRGGDKRPQLSDLRESGSIEQDADVVMFLYRPEYYGKTTTEEGHSTEGLAEVIIGKQRSGPTGTVNLLFHKNFTRFENLTQPGMNNAFPDQETQLVSDPALPPRAPETTQTASEVPTSADLPPIGYDPGGEEDAPF
jgi:replicative DNA helicase